jgi:glutaconate CoA-transferase subunit A
LIDVPSKVVSLDEAVAMVPDGCAVATGGVLLIRKPVALLDAIGRAGRRDLTLWTVIGSMDAEVLAAHGAMSASNAIYVGFEQHGLAPAFDAAVARGEVEATDWSEFLLMAGLRASVAGLPFLPTRGGRGSDVAAALGLAEVDCPYTGERLVAVPAIRPDVALLHVEVADELGNVPVPRHPHFLFDADAYLARASRRVIVSVERLADAGTLEGPKLLYGHEVDAIVVLPGGSRPTAVPGVHPIDVAMLDAYLRAARAGDARAALDAVRPS